MASKIKETQGWCTSTLVRPQLEHAAPIWNPHHQTEIDRIEKVQRTAARWACRRWRNESHVGEILEELQWPELQERRQQASLTFFYKIHNLVTIDKNMYLSEAGGNTSTRSHWCIYELKFSVFPRTIATWNGLTSEAVPAETVDGFKSKI